VLEQAGDGLLLEPLAGVARRDAGALGELVGRERPARLERAVEAELGPEVDGEQLERAEGGSEEALGELVGAIGGDHDLYGVRFGLTLGVRLASPMPSFVGRESEAARLAALVRDVPVVTVTGPGGVGKTTLAAHVAEQIAGEFADGMRWCDLAPIEGGGPVAATVAAALGGRNVPLADAEAELPGLVGGRRLLIVLDNCEHVTPRAAAVAAGLVASAGARVLATSRESLGLAEEHVFVLAPLAEADAVSLFADRAAAVRTGFALGPDNEPDVARLCRRLDGLPLAVELAAARARSLSPREIADRLDERFALLARRKTRAPDRQSSLRRAVDWSYELLSEPERALFDRLGVFAAGAGVGEVEAVCGGDGVLDLLDQLVDRSLVTTREVAGTTRYGMLETLRAYARERLAERGELEALRDRHADVYAAVADGLRLERLGAWDIRSLVRVSEMDDPLAALRWCVAHDADPGRAFRLLTPLWAVVHSRLAAEITDLAERALARWGGDPGAVTIRGVAAVGHFVLGEPDRSRLLAGEALAAETVAAPAVLARRALALVAYHFDRDLEEADRLLADVIAGAEAADSVWIAVEMSALRALVVAARGDLGAGLALAAGARERAEEARASHLVAWATYVLGTIELGWGERSRAAVTLAASLELARGLDYPLIVGGSLRHLGVVAALEGDRPAAAERLSAALEHFRAVGDRVQRWEALRSVAIALAAAGDAATAVRLLDGADAARVARGLAPVERELLAAVLPDRPEPGPGEDLETLTRAAGAALAGAPPRAGAVFRRDGALWTLAFAGREVRMPHLKGFADLAELLAQPGRAVHCLDLAGDGAVQGHLGEVIDARAREEYRSRAEELQAEIEDARRANDPAREERARDELGEIAEALEAAYGLGGRARRAGDPAERARSAVAWRIRSALRKLEGEHDQLARHLRNAVRTGTWCVYEPETPVRWEL
jgi:predicted ATPase